MRDKYEQVKPITHFVGEYSFLSNFYPCAITLDGDEYPTVEHAFQAAKTDIVERRKIREAASPASAKEIGRQVTLRENWDRQRLKVMETLVRQKFTRHADLREKLAATGSAELIEGNKWRDIVWGAVWDKDKARWIGKNQLGKILMKVRAELKS